MIDVEKVQRKSQLAKDLVKLGISSNFADASKKIESEGLVRNYPEKGKLAEKQIAQPAQSEEEKMEKLQEYALLVRRMNMLEAQLMQLSEKLKKHQEDVNQNIQNVQSSIQGMKQDTRRAQVAERPAEEPAAMMAKEAGFDPSVQKIFSNAGGRMTKH